MCANQSSVEIGSEKVTASAVSSLDSYSKDSYSSPFLADSTDSRVWALEYESGTR